MRFEPTTACRACWYSMRDYNWMKMTVTSFLCDCMLDQPLAIVNVDYTTTHPRRTGHDRLWD